MDNIRSFKIKPKGIWSLVEIQAGFNAFKNEFGRYPTALEIDKYEYLPSSRSIQRSYGGLVSLRKKLYPNDISDYTRGKYRSDIAAKSSQRAKIYEELFYEKLCNYLEPISVHEHKIIRPGGISCDFFIYVNDIEGICIDLFYAKDIFSVQGVINTKLRRYNKLLSTIIFILVDNESINQNTIEKLLLNRINLLPENIKLLTEDVFWETYLPSLVDKSKFKK